MSAAPAGCTAASGSGAQGLPALLFAYGFSLRKRAILRRFLPGRMLRFVRSARAVPPDSYLLLWGSGPTPEGLASDVRCVRVEDGFLRSVGLGAELVTPLSWVIDRRGIHYDASRPSDLEHLLQTTAFDAALMARAARLRERIVDSRLTKYNVGVDSWQRPATQARLILVPGQVESDAAIRLGTPGIRTNLGLLQAIRAANPDAHVLYKPHPDVVAGLRAAGQGEHEAGRWCDSLVGDVPMSDLLAEVDEVHVLTSLTGFEALLRGKRVVCYGQPFYAGWGLTTDAFPPARRSRRLALDELVAGALLLYPTYVAHGGGQVTTPELALDSLLAWRARSSAVAQRPWWRKALRACLSIRGRAR